MDSNETATVPTADGMHIQRHGDVTWIDVAEPSEVVFAQLERDYNIHPVHLEESVQKIQLTQVEREYEYLFLLLHFPVYEPETDNIRISQVGIFLGKDYLITIHSEPSPVLADVFAAGKHHAQHATDDFKRGSGFLLYAIVKKLLDDLSELGEAVFNELDEIETLVFDNTASDAYKIGKLRQKIIRLKRIVGPLKLVLGDLSQQIQPFSGEALAKYYANNAKYVNKLWEVVEEAKETIEVYKDADFTTSTEKTNEILAVLTLVFTFTIPITVIGTLYGMNVLLPGGIQVGSWTFFGRYTTLEVLAGLSAGLALGMYLYFKRKKWF